jgi:hypothetical protein
MYEDTTVGVDIDRTLTGAILGYWRTLGSGVGDDDLIATHDAEA